MAEGSLPDRTEAHPPPDPASRSWILVSCVVAVGALALGACVAVAGVGLESPSGPSAAQVLFYGETRSPQSGLVVTFQVPAPVNPSSLPLPLSSMDVRWTVEMGLECGGPSTLIGDVNNCTMALYPGAYGTGANATGPLWSSTFSGYVGQSVQRLAEGGYSLVVNVRAGAPPLAVVIVPFTATTEVETLTG
jgi:hypothetical protein